MVMASHHPAFMKNAMAMAADMEIPMASLPSTNPRLITKGTQLPIYPHAYPWEET